MSHSCHWQILTRIKSIYKLTLKFLTYQKLCHWQISEISTRAKFIQPLTLYTIQSTTKSLAFSDKFGIFEKWPIKNWQKVENVLRVKFEADLVLISEAKYKKKWNFRYQKPEKVSILLNICLHSLCLSTLLVSTLLVVGYSENEKTNP